MNDERRPAESAAATTLDPKDSAPAALLLSIPPAAVEMLVDEVAARVRATLHTSPWMTRGEAAEYLRWPVSRLEKRRDVPHVKDEGRVMYHRGEIDAWLLRENAA